MIALLTAFVLMAATLTLYSLAMTKYSVAPYERVAGRLKTTAWACLAAAAVSMTIAAAQAFQTQN